MKTSDTGINLIKSFEGIRDGDPSTVELDPYLCPADVVTAGWGHVLKHAGRVLRGMDGLRLARHLWPRGFTMEQAELWIREDVEEKEQEVESLLGVPVTQSQFDALVSFAFNVGTDIDADDIPEGLGDSTLLRKVNAGDYAGAANEFPKWTKARGRVLNGLTRRRAAERALFLAHDEVLA